MLKRIAVVGAVEPLRAKVAEGSGGHDVEAVTVRPGEVLPMGTAALVVDGETAAEAMELVLQQAAHFESLLDLVGFAIDAREQYVPGATQRVKEHATRFARALGLSPDDRLKLERGALIRDIGKLKVPNDVLLKKTVLTFEEWTMLQSHTHVGAEIVRELGFLGDTEDIVRWHHECFDGTGYPDELEGEEIPYLARAMKIVDAYCAMTVPRHYRKGYSTHEGAIEYLQSESGKHFDPALVKAFVEGEVGVPPPEGET